ncbi:hypothetical protein [Psychrobium sp. 1_MG-2023]|uniref:hypothetical protein n=1 Tax=Psychrobium sp. 1_MG-2023 TaxID=3062624 RepID=UPI000C33E448|nr:hypothetical protein [Psychrobium sp. 1_MG-2023]MDP2562365.1 hypothetical protein [Psychrobium sp. 1_MG-2023]PKF55869.1 hypothetical protein CW748_12105 [Alteromonadales bacterium alter-6D02]
MKNFMIRVSMFVMLSVMSVNSHAAEESSSALYRVERVQQVLRLIDPKCIEDKQQTCDKTKHWRVYFKALSVEVPRQEYQKLVDANPPQEGSIHQLTIKKAE